MADRKAPNAPRPPRQVPPGFEDVFKVKQPLEEGESSSPPSELEALDFSADPPAEPVEDETPEEELPGTDGEPTGAPAPPPPAASHQLLDLDTVAALFAKLGPTMQSYTAPPAPQSIEQSAIHLLSLLDDRFVGVIQELAARQAKGSVALVIAGILTQVGDQGNFGDFSLNPAWQEKIHQVPQSPMSLYANSERVPLAQAKCEGCGHDYKPARFQQRFCCTPCGKLAAHYGNEGLPHATDCTTLPGRLLKEATAKAKVGPPPSDQEAVA